MSEPTPGAADQGGSLADSVAAWTPPWARPDAAPDVPDDPAGADRAEAAPPAEAEPADVVAEADAQRAAVPAESDAQHAGPVESDAEDPDEPVESDGQDPDERVEPDAGDAGEPVAAGAGADDLPVEPDTAGAGVPVGSDAEGADVPAGSDAQDAGEPVGSDAEHADERPPGSEAEDRGEPVGAAVRADDLPVESEADVVDSSVEFDSGESVALPDEMSEQADAPGLSGTTSRADEPGEDGTVDALRAGDVADAGTEVAGAAGPVDVGAGAVPAARASTEDAGQPLPELDDPTVLRAALEAILMVVDEPVPEVMLAQVLERPTETVAVALRALAAEYAEQRRGFELRQAAGGWRIYTRDDFAPYVERFVLDGQQVRLTQAALETLAVVAYKQPVSRGRVSAIRGVNCDGVIRTLLTRGLIEECGAEPDSGAHLYRTTVLFLERMGINSVDELPELAPFLPDDLPEEA